MPIYIRKTVDKRQYNIMIMALVATFSIMMFFMLRSMAQKMNAPMVSPAPLSGFERILIEEVEVEVPINTECSTQKCQIVAYIAEVFEDHAPDAIAMLNQCENNGLDPDATNYNNNGTIDRGIFQVNSIHGGLELYDWQQNIDKAYEIFKAHDNTFYAWTCATIIGQRNYLSRR